MTSAFRLFDARVPKVTFFVPVAGVSASRDTELIF